MNETFNDYTIDEIYFCQDCPYTRLNEMVLTYSGLF